MELFLSEDKAKEIWDDPKFLSLIEGASGIVATVVTTSANKYLALVPIKIVFEGYIIELDGIVSDALAQVIDFAALKKEE